MKTQEIHWYENEQKMFEDWLFREEGEWRVQGFTDYEKTALGISEQGNVSQWDSDMYRLVHPYSEEFNECFTYVFKNAGLTSYMVDLWYKDFQFRMNFCIRKYEFISKMFYKKLVYADYGSIHDCANFSKEEKEGLKESVAYVFDFYEKVKEFVVTKKENRLYLLTKGFVLDETQVDNLKIVIKTYL